jgi:hypothetical protein
MEHQHFALAPRSGSPGWVSLTREGDPWRATGVESRSLEAVLPGTYAKLRLNPISNFTFTSGRHARMLVTDIQEEQPTAEAVRKMVQRASITMLIPIGSPHYPDLWVHCWRDPRGGLTVSKRFVTRTLVEEIAEWFAFFGPQKIERGLTGVIELWCRRNWSAFDWFGEAEFPGPKPQPVKPPLTAQQAALKARNEKMRSLARIKERREAAAAR